MSEHLVIEEPPAAAPNQEPQGRERVAFDTIAILAFVVAMAAAIAAVFAIALAVRSIDEHRAIPEGGAGGGAAAVSVELSEFSIAPEPLAVPAGGSLSVANAGSVAHDLNVEGLTTPELAPGDDAVLDLSTLDPGTYSVYCQIAGHREAGMESELVVE